jgi:hypothetical protein
MSVKDPYSARRKKGPEITKQEETAGNSPEIEDVTRGRTAERDILKAQETRKARKPPATP